MSDIEKALAASLFAEGFKAGADPKRATRRTLVEVRPGAHDHWRAGYEAGRAAAEQAIAGYRDALGGSGA